MYNSLPECSSSPVDTNMKSWSSGCFGRYLIKQRMARKRPYIRECGCDGVLS